MAKESVLVASAETCLKASIQEFNALKGFLSENQPGFWNYDKSYELGSSSQEALAATIVAGRFNTCLEGRPLAPLLKPPAPAKQR